MVGEMKENGTKTHATGKARRSTMKIYAGKRKIKRILREVAKRM